MLFLALYLVGVCVAGFVIRLVDPVEDDVVLALVWPLVAFIAMLYYPALLGAWVAKRWVAKRNIKKLTR